jgi:hypothetical protein
MPKQKNQETSVSRKKESKKERVIAYARPRERRRRMYSLVESIECVPLLESKTITKRQ